MLSDCVLPNEGAENGKEGESDDEDWAGRYEEDQLEWLKGCHVLGGLAIGAVVLFVAALPLIVFKTQGPPGADVR